MRDIEISESFMEKYGKNDETFVFTTFGYLQYQERYSMFKNLIFLLIFQDFDPCSGNCAEIHTKNALKTNFLA